MKCPASWKNAILRDGQLTAAPRSSAGGNPFQLGQVSLETLLVFLIFLIVLGISYTAASAIGAAAQKKIDSSLARQSFAEFSAMVSETCSLGNGNVRIVEIKGPPATVAAEGNSYSFSAGPFSATANSSCGISAPSQPAKSFTIQNINGKIGVSGR